MLFQLERQLGPFQIGGKVKPTGRDDKIIIGLPEWKNACVNVNDVINIPDEDLIFYSDIEDQNSDVYCFPINELLDKFSREIFIISTPEKIFLIRL